MEKDQQQMMAAEVNPDREEAAEILDAEIWEEEEEEEEEEDIDWLDDEEEEEPPFGLEGNDPDDVRNRPYPEISAEEQQLVDQWSETCEELTDPDAVRQHLQDFMQKYPGLVENLELDQDVLFDLGTAYRAVGRPEAYITLLLQVRKEFPDTYIRAAGFYDFDIIAWLIAQGRTDEIESYLDYFKAYPDLYVDELTDTVDLLRATDNTALLPQLINDVAEKIITSPRVFFGEDIVDPLVMHLLSKYLHAGYTQADIEGFIEDLQREVGSILVEVNLDPVFWKQRFEHIFRPFGKWPEEKHLKKKQMTERYAAISHNFMRYLVEQTGISWISAAYYAELMMDFLFEHLELTNGAVKKMFRFSKEVIQKIVLELFSSIVFKDCLKPLGTLNGLYYFAGYLRLCGMVDEKTASGIRADCTALYEEGYPGMKKEYTEAWCFPRFPFRKENNDPAAEQEG
jgi:hypothetical protein